MSLVRKARKPRRTKLIKKWTASDGTRYWLSQRPSGEYEAESGTKKDIFTCAIGSTPKRALAHLTSKCTEYTEASKDAYWAGA